jgi:DNA-binding transcriptional MerR regulator/effector-binding domain-containing protein
MSACKRYRIGEFSRLAATSIKTLRFYDERGLLKPVAVDARTRYRYYDAAQLRDLAAIRALKDLGASLEDILRVMSRSDAEHERRQLLIRLRSAALHTLAAARCSLDWIDLELEDAGLSLAETPVVLKLRGEMRIASIRARLRSYDDIVPVERDLTRALQPAMAGEQRGVLWHRCEASGAIEGEPFVEVRGTAPRGSGFELKHLPGARVASAYCESDDAAAMRTYDAIDRWIHRHELRLDGPKREIYVGQLLEIQFPVRAA